MPTTGYLIYESDDDNGVYGKIAAPGGAAVTHAVWIPGTGPNATYTYCVVATDPTSGASAVSSLGTLTTGNGPVMGSTSLLFASPTEMDIAYDSEEPLVGLLQPGSGTCRREDRIRRGRSERAGLSMAYDYQRRAGHPADIPAYRPRL